MVCEAFPGLSCPGSSSSAPESSLYRVRDRPKFLLSLCADASNRSARDDRSCNLELPGRQPSTMADVDTRPRRWCCGTIRNGILLERVCALLAMERTRDCLVGIFRVESEWTLISYTGLTQRLRVVLVDLQDVMKRALESRGCGKWFAL